MSGWQDLTTDNGRRVEDELHKLLCAGWSDERIADLLKSVHDHELGTSCGYVQAVREAEREYRRQPAKPSLWQKARRRVRR